MTPTPKSKKECIEIFQDEFNGYMNDDKYQKLIPSLSTALSEYALHVLEEARPKLDRIDCDKKNCFNCDLAKARNYVNQKYFENGLKVIREEKI